MLELYIQGFFYAFGFLGVFYFILIQCIRKEVLDDETMRVKAIFIYSEFIFILILLIGLKVMSL